MKKLILLAAFFTAGTTINQAGAQLKVNINLNIESQPVWGPAGYDYVQYYYMPDIDVYYYVPTHRYVYLDKGHWIFSAYLPVRYRNYNMFNTYKVVINEPRAYEHHSVHVIKYQKYKGNNGKQVIIRNSADPKYVAVNAKYRKENERKENDKKGNENHKKE